MDGVVCFVRIRPRPARERVEGCQHFERNCVTVLSQQTHVTATPLQAPECQPCPVRWGVLCCAVRAMLTTAPPRAVPSSLVRMMPLSCTVSLNSLACGRGKRNERQVRRPAKLSSKGSSCALGRRHITRELSRAQTAHQQSACRHASATSVSSLPEYALLPCLCCHTSPSCCAPIHVPG